MNERMRLKPARSGRSARVARVPGAEPETGLVTAQARLEFNPADAALGAEAGALATVQRAPGPGGRQAALLALQRSHGNAFAARVAGRVQRLSVQRHDDPGKVDDRLT